MANRKPMRRFTWLRRKLPMSLAAGLFARPALVSSAVANTAQADGGNGMEDKNVRVDELLNQNVFERATASVWGLACLRYD